MDAHLMVKIIHMSTVLLLAVVLLGRGLSLWVAPQGNMPNPKGRVLLVALQHLSLSIFVLTGGILLYMKDFQVQPWFYAKMLLFVAMLSSLIKAFSKKPEVLLLQRRAGWGIATLAFVAIIGLVLIKPVFA